MDAKPGDKALGRYEVPRICEGGFVRDRTGIVYIAPSGDAECAFVGYWDQVDPPQLLEEGPGWDEVEDAIAWGRDRADRVMVRLGEDETTIYSAGSIRLTTRADDSGDPYPEWPPIGRDP